MGDGVAGGVASGGDVELDAAAVAGGVLTLCKRQIAEGVCLAGDGGGGDVEFLGGGGHGDRSALVEQA